MDDLIFEELNKSGVSDETIQEFDCGNEDITEYLHSQAKQDSIDGNGVTYVLVRKDKRRIYAYVTIKAHSLYRYESSEKYHTHEGINGQVLVSFPAVEIKMFAVRKSLQKQPAIILYPDEVYCAHCYSTIFFNRFLEELFYMSMDTIGFQFVFLRANKEGENLYRRNGFTECDEYLATYDAKGEGCISLIASLSTITNNLLW